jgi:integrase/recombinase XerC/integrase/recombinase XerD
MSTHISNQETVKKLSECIEYYDVCNRAEGKSPKTISWYSGNLRCFRNYLKSRHLPDTIDNIDTKLLREYILYLLQQTKYTNHPFTPAQTELLSASTVHGHVRTLRAFFSWLVTEGLIAYNVTNDLKPPKVPRKVVSTLSDEEIRAILSTFRVTSPSEARNQTIFMLLLDSGLRIGELVNLKIEDIQMNEGLMKVMGKGKKERIVPIGNNAQRALQRYLFRYRPEPTHKGLDNVFLSINGKPLTENSIKLMFTRLAQRAGVNRLHAHLCRHTFATRFLINGGDVFSLQQILGHSTLEMVRHYVNLASNHIVIQHQKFSPLDRFNLRK